MKHYKTLIKSAIYRDGGSLEARFQCADGTFESLWLQAILLRTGEKSEFGYGALRYSEDAEGAKEGIEVQENKESEIISDLQQFLSQPESNVPFGHKTDTSVYLKHAELLESGIKIRIKTEVEPVE